MANPLFPAEDGDQLTDEDRAALEKVPEPPPTEPPPPEKPPETPPIVEPRPERNFAAENQRLREQRDRLRQEKEERDRQLMALQEENIRFKARRDLAKEEMDRLEEAKIKQTRPDPEADPYGARMWDLERKLEEHDKLNTELKAEKERQKEWAEQNEKAAAEQKVLREFLDADVASFKADNPDVTYDDEANYTYEKYTTYWKNRGMSQGEANALCANMFMALGAAAKARGGSAAQGVHELASMLGYQPKAAAPAAPPANPASTPPPKESAKARIDRLKKGQALQGLGGKDASARNAADDVSQMTAEDIESMSDDDWVAMKQNKELAPVLNKRLSEL